MNKQTGFTLIELIVVIVILGILAATALPKFINLSGEADTAAVNGVAGALGSASSINYAAKMAGNTNAVPIANCQDVTNAMQDMPAGYTLTSQAISAAGVAQTCTVGKSATVTANFTAIGA